MALSHHLRGFSAIQAHSKENQAFEAISSDAPEETTLLPSYSQFQFGFVKLTASLSWGQFGPRAKTASSSLGTPLVC